MARPHDLKGMRDSALRRVDWSNAPPSAQSRVDAFLNEAQDQVSMEAPFLFHETFVRFSTSPDVSSADDTDTCRVDSIDDIGGATYDAVNPYIIVKHLPIVSAGNLWAAERSWDGRMIDLTDASGNVHTNQIRTMWIEQDYPTAGQARQALSLVQPFPVNSYGTGPFTWRIYTPIYYLPDDTVEIKSMRIVGQDYPRQFDFLSQDEAESIGIVDPAYGDGGGPPRWAYRRGHFQLPGLNTAPVAAADSTRWFGPEPPGQFAYVVTLSWGQRYLKHRNAGGPTWDWEGSEPTVNDAFHAADAESPGTMRQREPVFESAPSPSVSFTVSAPTTGPDTLPFAAELTIPAFEYMLGFGAKGLSSGSTVWRRSQGQSGIYARIWRKRISADFTNYSAVFGSVAGSTRVDGLSLMDIQDEYYLLAEVKMDAFTGRTFVDNGKLTPDYSRRLRDIHGYQGIRLHPQPDGIYELEARVLRRPPALVSDSDVPHIHPEGTKVIVDYAMILLYEHMKDPIAAGNARAEYRRSLDALGKRFGDMRPVTQPVRKRPARTSRSTRIGIRWWSRD